ncbi:MAG: DedA family protein [Chlamydiota bacterium]
MGFEEASYIMVFMDSLSAFILAHGKYAHFAVFGAILLAGMNIPISIDIVVIISALVAARMLPEQTIHLYLSVLLGCYFAAWIAYGIGRYLGPYALRISFISKVLSKSRLEKARQFYEKRGLLALILGRFIPFGVRNCLFMSAGMSRMSFIKFISLDALACLIWCTGFFFLFYSLGSNYEALVSSMKLFNLVVFAAFSVTVIGIICYKKRKKTDFT